MKVLITGGSGFIGAALLRELAESHVTVRTAGRSSTAFGYEFIRIPSIDRATDWVRAVAGIDVVVHLAARVHVMRDNSFDPLQEFRRVNTEGTANLAEQAAKAGVRRLVFLSTIKVNGEFTEGQPFVESDAVKPQDPYAISKWEAEMRLHDISAHTGLEVVIVRPPLVYGPGVKGNVARLLRWVKWGVPLPFADVANRRSLLALKNLVDFIVRCLDHPRAAGETFLISDGKDLSTADLVRGLAAGMGTKAWLVPIPEDLIHRALAAIDREDVWQRLWGSLQVDSGRARRMLCWQPPVEVAQGLADTGSWFRDRQQGH